MRFLLLIIILISYGSLYPFDFVSTNDLLPRIDKLLNLAFWNAGITDSIANILLFVPLGMSVAFIWGRLYILKLLLVMGIIFLFAFGIQVIQLWSITRIPFGSDAIWNLIGATLGWLTVLHFSNFLPKFNFTSPKAQHTFLMLSGAFVVIDLQPFIPTIDLGLIYGNLKQFINYAELSPVSTLRHCAFYLILLIIFRFGSNNAHSLMRLGASLTILIIIQLLVVDSELSINQLFGAIIAFTVFSLYGARVTFDQTKLLVIFLIIINGIGGLSYRSDHAFNWIPFAPALSGNTLTNIWAIGGKSVFYFLYFYLSLLTHISPLKSIAKLSLIVFILEVFQTNISGATPDITENIVVLIVGWLTLKWYRRKNEHSEKFAALSFSAMFTTLLKLKPAKVFFTYWIIAVAAQASIMSLPQLPYNVAELYHHKGSLITYSFMYFSVACLALGVTWIAKLHSQDKIGHTKIAWYCSCVLMASFLLLKLAVTRESIADINGSSNITYQLIGLKVLGEVGADFVSFWGIENFKATTQIIEPYFRFAALFGPVFYFLIVFLSVSYRDTSQISIYSSIKHMVISLAFLLPWLFACKVISFDFSSSDNLNELIAREGSYKMGGGGFLYGLIALFSATVAAITYSIQTKTTRSFITCFSFFTLSVPFSWWLLNNGLVESFDKYGNTFSGVDFLIGGSRKELLSDSVLMTRWGIAYSMLVIGLSMLVSFAQSIINLTSSTSIAPSTNVGSENNFITQIKKLTINWKLAFTLTLMVGGGYLAFTNFSQFNSNQTIAWASKDTNIIFDHHTHSNASDGKLDVDSLAKLASNNGCDAFAITDHTDALRTLKASHLDKIKLARVNFPGLLILSGAELNPPSYKGREHVNVLFSKAEEKNIYNELLKGIHGKKKNRLTDNKLFNLLSNFNEQETNVLAIYNHPSRKDKLLSENKEDYLKWNQSSDLFIGFSGAPGHQKSDDVGSYRGEFSPINRWDPVIAEVGNALDQLLDEGHNVWGAIASSDFHNNKMDFAPCEFSRIHVSAPEKSYSGLFKALKAGTFWASHGNFLTGFKMNAEVSEQNIQLYPGEIGNIDKESLALVTINVSRTKEFLGLPLEVDLITNCSIGKPEQLEVLKIPAFKNSTSALLPLNKTGKDGQSCYIRSRISTSLSNGNKYYAYTNHIRFIFE